MATAQRQHDDIVALIENEGSRFGFFQAVHLLHRLIPDSTPVGELGPIASEPVRFQHDPSLVFHSSDVHSIQVKKVNGATRAVMTTTFLGLTGSSSPMATVFAEDVLRAEAAEETSLRAFYDLFHHRLISLFYRTWKKYRFTVGFKSDGSDVFSRKMLSFVGVDIGGAVHERGLGPLELLGMAPLLATRTRSGRLLNIILERALPEGVGLRMEPFVARRIAISTDERVLIGRQKHQLGFSFSIGKSVVDRSGRFRITVGPVDQEMFDSLLPGGSRHDAFRDVVQQFLPPHVEAELEVLLGAGNTTAFQLGVPRASTLGASTRIPVTGAHQTMRARVLLGVDGAVPEIVPADQPDDL
jgi:type VI secretion system protein ImpH